MHPAYFPVFFWSLLLFASLWGYGEILRRRIDRPEFADLGSNDHNMPEKEWIVWLNDACRIGKWKSTPEPVGYRASVSCCLRI